MPRKSLEHSLVLPYHVGGRSNNKEWFHAPIERVWDVFCREIVHVHREMGVVTHAFVLMSNHFHWVPTCTKEDISKVMQHVMGSVAKTLNRISGRRDHVFGGPYRGSLIRDEVHFDCVMKYVFRNPVKAEMVPTVESYPFSTLNRVIARAELPFPIGLPVGLEADWLRTVGQENVLKWLNEPFLNEQNKIISTALKRAEFKPAKRPWRDFPPTRGPWR